MSKASAKPASEVRPVSTEGSLRAEPRAETQRTSKPGQWLSDHPRMATGDDELRVLSGRSNPLLATRVADALGISLAVAKVDHFPDSETIVKVEEDVRGRDVFVIQSTCPPVNDSLMELLIAIDCLRRASAKCVTAVIPYFGYARQDRKDEGRVPITAKLVANLLVTAGANRVLTMDLHAAQIQGFFDIPVDHLQAQPVISTYIREVLQPRYGLSPQTAVVVSPDVGNSKRAQRIAEEFGLDIAIVDKRRTSGQTVESKRMIGDVAGKHVLMFDDMISTAGTVTEAAKFVKQQGASTVTVAATHPVLCGPAITRLSEAPIDQLIFTDTIPVADDVLARLGNAEVLSVSHLLAEAIWRIHRNQSVSQLFKKRGKRAEGRPSAENRSPEAKATPPAGDCQRINGRP